MMMYSNTAGGGVTAPSSTEDRRRDPPHAPQGAGAHNNNHYQWHRCREMELQSKRESNPTASICISGRRRGGGGGKAAVPVAPVVGQGQQGGHGHVRPQHPRPQAHALETMMGKQVELVRLVPPALRPHRKQHLGRPLTLARPRRHHTRGRRQGAEARGGAARGAVWVGQSAQVAVAGERRVQVVLKEVLEAFGDGDRGHGRVPALGQAVRQQAPQLPGALRPEEVGAEVLLGDLARAGQHQPPHAQLGHHG
mmetsp:Transcript_4060/g.7200  ORF Transcript_4060/g.7200 Transcript_4060/m.7200 type:complete len:252 (-) Transcript_4060:554-1309(-)